MLIINHNISMLIVININNQLSIKNDSWFVKFDGWLIYKCFNLWVLHYLLPTSIPKTSKTHGQETLKEPLSKADAQARLDAALAAKVPDF